MKNANQQKPVTPPPAIVHQNHTTYLLCPESGAQKIGPVRPLTPKEFSAAIGSTRSARWVCEKIRSGEIQSLTRTPPYIVPASELARFRPSLGFAVS